MLINYGAGVGLHDVRTHLQVDIRLLTPNHRAVLHLKQRSPRWKLSKRVIVMYTSHNNQVQTQAYVRRR